LLAWVSFVNFSKLIANGGSAKRSAHLLFLGILLLAGCGGGGGGGSGTPPPKPVATGLARVNHIVVMMQENHSFDNYLGPCRMRQRRPTIRVPVHPAITPALTD
jgi:phosphoesterase family protein